MNFLAIPTLKNDRACFPLPISIMPLCSLNVTFDRERTGMARVGSLRCWAAVITVSATPTSFFSTALFVFPFFRVMMLPISSSASRVSWVPRQDCSRASCVEALAWHAPCLCVCAPARFPTPCLALRTGLIRRLSDQRRHFTFNALRRDDNRMRETFRATSLLPQELVRLFAAGPLQSDLLKLLFELLGGQFATLEAVTRVNNFLDVEFEDVAAMVLALGPLASFKEGPQPAAACAAGQRDLLRPH